MPRIDGKTRVYGILGHPVRHTLSPHMYNPLFDQLGLNAVYVPFEVPLGLLPEAIRGLRALGIVGVHLTAPHKEAVIPHLDRLSREAQVIGAVNVVLNRQGMLYGDNTDGRGFLRSIQRSLGFEPHGKTLALLGAGGSARAVAFTMARVGAARLEIFNRTVSRAERLASEVQFHHPDCSVQIHPLEEQAFGAVSEALDAVVDCTCPDPGSPVNRLPLHALPAHALICDLNYHNPSSGLLANARALGRITHTGQSMLVHQGAMSMALLAGLTIKPELLEGYLSSHALHRAPPPLEA